MRDSTVVRQATAKAVGTTIGAEAQVEFRSSSQPRWFENAPQI